MGKFEEQAKLLDFMEVDQSLATTGIQTLDKFTASTNNSIQAVPKSKDNDPEFQSIPPKSLSML
jgi:hypothetical protein